MTVGAAEYFRKMSPVKGGVYENGTSNITDKSGRCQCCPYGYHIDLDFVRYCQALNQGSKNDSPTLVELKRIKKARRRQTKSMEVMLGISGLEVEKNRIKKETHCTTIHETKLASINSSLNQRAASLRKSRRSVDPPSPPPRKASLTHPALRSPPPPDLINSSSLILTQRNDAASVALQEAMVDFEETLENSRESSRRKSRFDTTTIDLLHHTDSASQSYLHHTMVGPRASRGLLTNGTTVTRSNSLPRHFLHEPYLSRNSHYKEPLGMSQSFTYSNGYANQNPLISDAMAALSAAQGMSATRMPDFDSMSMTSAVSGVSTTTLQSIRDHMATGLSRLKELEEEVKAMPSMHLKQLILLEEKRILIECLRSLPAFNGGKFDSFPLPSFSLDRDNIEPCDDELKSRLDSLRFLTGDREKRRLERKRSLSPMRVNLHDFHSYRRARRNSFSDCSDTESVASISLRSERDAPPMRLLDHRTASQTPSEPPKSRRDVGVGARVLTREIGVNHVPPRSRSVGTATIERGSPEPPPCARCLRRSLSPSRSLSRSCESASPERQESEDTPRGAFLATLGRKSGIISRLSSPKLSAPPLTFDNATNTDPPSTRHQRCNTTLLFEDVFTRTEMQEEFAEARLRWVAERKTSEAQKAPSPPLIVTSSRSTQTPPEPPPPKPKPPPTMHSVSVSVKPQTRDAGVGFFFAEEKSRQRGRSVACGPDTVGGPPKPRSRSVASGDGQITDVTCDHCRGKRSVSVSIQTMRPSVRSIGIEVTPPPALTPEAERRSLGSASVRICDKCHETITSLAKDVVGLPVVPVPTVSSKIPRLMEPVKTEPVPTIIVAPPVVSKSSAPVFKEVKEPPLPPPRVQSRPEPPSDDSSAMSSMEASPQVQRAVFKRQDTYTKTSTSATMTPSEGQRERKESPERAFRESSPEKAKLPRKDSLEKIKRRLPSRSPEKTREKSASPKRKSVSSISSTPPASSSEDEGASMATEVSSVVTVESRDTLATHDTKERKKAHPSRGMKAALKVLNDSIGKPTRSGQQLTNAFNIVQKEWFKVAGQKDTDPQVIEDYMDAFEEFSKNLLHRVVNLADNNGNTVMHYGVSHGNFDVVSVLLNSKVCNMNYQNKAGYTAAMLVALAQIRSEPHQSVVKKLFECGDVNIKASQHGQTALMLAVSHGRADMVRLLIAAAANPNLQDEDGSTALMCAAEHGHLAIVRFLIAQPDTDLYLMDNDGSTALTIAVEAGHKDVGVLLYKQMNLSRGSSPYSSMRIKRPRTPTLPPPRSSAPASPGRSRKSSGRNSPANPRQSSASLSNLNL